MNSCATCDHFAAGEGDASMPPVGQTATVGICRRYPPRVLDASLTSVFPAVHRDQICGEFHYEGFVI